MSLPVEMIQRSRTENEAKRAYEVWAHRVGASTPYERLSLTEWQAWKEVVANLTDEPDCTCGRSLYCVVCDEVTLKADAEPPECGTCEKLLVCPECGGDPLCGECNEPLVCPKCEAALQMEAGK
jgi:hypothetical protein